MPSEWLDNSIANEHIKFYDKSNFKNKQFIGRGSYGTVYRINWKNKHIFALKTFNNDQEATKEVVKELKLHRKVNNHKNIIQLYGVTMLEPSEH
ncbi:15007_t:CDS:2 [Funneliformis caledonium]|uniref:15007_t:CDS:1 n=1 Tax=Funneliformis caledonium TaxID=1117310 RepID=A0A9N8VNV6_9GLOM|nr:15007_t:CDS:2 [Funneliformis caledonium]